ncbi:MAG TPA: hypothetical protein VJP86_12100 [Vicinamibacterales bacterium]|jgi:hypothetical protein|nr:hypothetical protein [Steroidobacteraceae bacterium]HKT80956.1 hypothetical protein [Vicinamibacterales bacterium]
MTPEPELHHHAHRTGHRWVDFAVPLSALAVSMISLAIAIHHGHTMQKMADENARLVQANSWPLLQFTTGNANDKGEPEITLNVENAGVGPAKLISLEIFHGDQRIRTPRDLVQALDPATTRPQLSLGLTMPVVVRAGDSQLLIGLKRQGQETFWDKLNTARFELRFRACYCSVFDECWVSDLATVSPQHIDHCAVNADTFTYLSPQKAN